MPLSAKLTALTRNQWFLGAALFSLTFVAFLPGLGGAFIWDDDVTLTRNPLIGLPGGLARIWFSTEATDYYPLTWSSLWLEWRLWKLNPAGYHVSNLVLHGLNTVLVWRILRKMNFSAAWGVALLFGLHPLGVESVVWISQRKNTLSFFFAAIAVLSFLHYRAGTQKTSYLLALGAFTAALLSKSSVIALPLVLLMLVWGGEGALRRKDFAILVPFLALSAVSAVITLWFQHKVMYAGVEAISMPFSEFLGQDTAAGRNALTLPQQLAVSGHVFWFYFAKTLLPLNLCMVYEKWGVDPLTWKHFVPLAGVLVLLVALAGSRGKTGRTPLAAIACALAILLPVLGFFTMAFHGYTWVAHHLAYLVIPCFLGFFLCIAAIAGKRLKLPPPFGAACLTVVAILFALQTWQRAGLYRSPESLWRDNVTRAPGAFAAHNNLGIELCKRDAYEEGIAHFNTAMELAPQLLDARMNLATALLRTGETDAAIAHYESIHRIKPGRINVMHNLALAYLRAGRLPDAEQFFREVLQRSPRHAAATCNLALILGRTERDAEAEEIFPAALGIDPESATLHVGFARVLYRRNKYDDALQHGLMAVMLEPAEADKLISAAREARARALERNDSRAADTLSQHEGQYRQ